MDVLGIPTQPIDSENESLLKSVELDDAAKGLVLESSEILNELTIRSKPWKLAKLQPQELAANISMELIDVLFYLLEVSVLLGLTQEDIIDLYMTKLNSNLKRVISSTGLDSEQGLAARRLLKDISG